MKRFILISFILILLNFMGCMSVYKFNKINVQSNAKIAVIIAETKNSEINAQFADMLTDNFIKQSSYSVLSQERVKQVLGDYPSRIHGPYKSAFYSVDEDQTKVDKGELASIAEKLGVDMLYVVWMPIHGFGNNNGMNMEYTCGIIQAFTFPAGDVIATSKPEMFHIIGNGPTIGSQPKTMDKTYHLWAEALVKQFIEKTGAVKK